MPRKRSLFAALKAALWSEASPLATELRKAFKLAPEALKGQLSEALKKEQKALEAWLSFSKKQSAELAAGKPLSEPEA